MNNFPDFMGHDHDHAEGERQRDIALARIAEKRPALKLLLQRAALAIALERGTVTADDVRAAVPIPSNVNPKLNGAALRALAALGILTAGDYVPSGRPVAHARPVRVWHLADRDWAHLWLASNPEPAESEPTT